MRHMGAATPECRQRMREYDTQRQRQERERREQERQALSERVPEHLGRTYQAIRMPDGEILTRQNRVSHLAAYLGVSCLAVRVAIDTGKPQRHGSALCQGTYHYKIAPVEPE